MRLPPHINVVGTYELTHRSAQSCGQKWCAVNIAATLMGGFLFTSAAEGQTRNVSYLEVANRLCAPQVADVKVRAEKFWKRLNTTTIDNDIRIKASHAMVWERTVVFTVMLRDQVAVVRNVAVNLGEGKVSSPEDYAVIESTDDLIACLALNQEERRTFNEFAAWLLDNVEVLPETVDLEAVENMTASELTEELLIALDNYECSKWAEFSKGVQELSHDMPDLLARSEALTERTLRSCDRG